MDFLLLCGFTEVRSPGSTGRRLELTEAQALGLPWPAIDSALARGLADAELSGGRGAAFVDAETGARVSMVERAKERERMGQARVKSKREIDMAALEAVRCVVLPNARNVELTPLVWQWHMFGLQS